MVVHNIISDNLMEGIALQNGSTRCMISNNVFKNNCQSGGTAAVSLDNSSNNSLVGNIISSTGSNAPGITVANDSSFNNVASNTIFDCGSYGIYLLPGTTGTPSNNAVCGNITKGYSSSAIYVSGGNTTNNTIQANTYSGQSQTVDSAAFRRVVNLQPVSGVFTLTSDHLLKFVYLTGNGTTLMLPSDVSNFIIGVEIEILDCTFLSPLEMIRKKRCTGSTIPLTHRVSCRLCPFSNLPGQGTHSFNEQTTRSPVSGAW